MKVQCIGIKVGMGDLNERLTIFLAKVRDLEGRLKDKKVKRDEALLWFWRISAYKFVRMEGAAPPIVLAIMMAREEEAPEVNALDVLPTMVADFAVALEEDIKDLIQCQETDKIVAKAKQDEIPIVPTKQAFMN